MENTYEKALERQVDALQKQNDMLAKSLREIQRMANGGQAKDIDTARITCMTISDAVTSALDAAGVK